MWRSLIKFSILFSGLSFILFPFFIGTKFLDPLVFEKKQVEFYVSPTNAGAARQLSLFLEKERIIGNARMLRGILSFLGQDKKIKSGYYEFVTGMSYFHIVRMLQKNKVVTIDVTIAPGQDLFDVTNHLIAVGLFTKKQGLSFLQEEQHSVWGPYLQKSLGISQNITNIEGFLLPNTYKIPKGSPFKKLLDLCIGEYKKSFANELQNKKFYTTLIKASLIEKEAFLPQEKSIIAGVIENRLQTGKKLEFCSSLLYAMRLQQGKNSLVNDFVYNIRTQDFSLTSKHNTYQKKGLPPTPICNPSVTSVRSALNPQKTDYLFFVSKGDGTRSHAFSKTYAEHEKNIQLYQRNSQ